MKFRTFRILATLGAMGAVVTGVTLLTKQGPPPPQTSAPVATQPATESTIPGPSPDKVGDKVGDKVDDKVGDKAGDKVGENNNDKPTPTTPAPQPASPKVEEKAAATALPEPPVTAKDPKAAKAGKGVSASGKNDDAAKVTGESMRPFDAAVLTLLKKPIVGDKVKDALPKDAVKINLFGAGGKVARLKLDLNRNDKWDEKWDLVSEGGAEVIHRQTAPADDENYTKKYRLDGNTWVPEK